MPSYFPEGNTPRPTDSFERLLQKAASLVSARNGGADAPSPDDSRERTMYKFVKGLSASISESSNLDPDALAYAAASGAADVAAIDAFVKGVKSLGLWNNMVCWPLRSRQNAGTGTVVHSLGGLGTFNGSIVNGATWGVDGLIANNAGYVTTDITNLFFPGGSTPWNLIVCFSSPASTGGGTLISRASGVEGERVFQLYGTSEFSVIARGTNQTPPEPVLYRGVGRKFVSLKYDGSNLTLDSHTLAVGAAADNAWPLQFMARTNGLNALTNNSELIAVVGIHGASSDTQNITSLYKSTLGTGLGLP